MRKKNIIELTQCTAEEYREKEKLPIALMVDNVRSLHNIGAMFRTADAFLVKEIVLAGISGVPPHPEISKTALGAEEMVEWRHVEDAIGEAKQMKLKGWKICVLEQVHGSIPLPEFKRMPDEKCLLVVGNEVSGVSQEIVDMADYVLEIPQYGTKHSLNVSVSAGIALYQLCFLYGKDSEF